jgi:hypothetical protein
VAGKTPGIGAWDGPGGRPVDAFEGLEEKGMDAASDSDTLEGTMEEDIADPDVVKDGTDVAENEADKDVDASVDAAEMLDSPLLALTLLLETALDWIADCPSAIEIREWSPSESRSMFAQRKSNAWGIHDDVQSLQIVLTTAHVLSPMTLMITMTLVYVTIVNWKGYLCE